MSVFDEDLFLQGLEQRKSTLGAEYVERNLAAADDFTRPFQEAMTAWCWGFGWGDDTLDAKTRSMLNLSMIGALGKMQEWELHCRGAINNGVTKEEVRAIIHVIAIYCGVPQGLECFRVARKVFEEGCPPGQCVRAIPVQTSSASVIISTSAGPSTASAFLIASSIPPVSVTFSP